MFGVALRTSRELPGGDVTQALMSDVSVAAMLLETAVSSEPVLAQAAQTKVLDHRPVLWVGAGASMAAGYRSTGRLVAAMIESADEPDRLPDLAAGRTARQAGRWSATAARRACIPWAGPSWPCITAGRITRPRWPSATTGRCRTCSPSNVGE